MTRPFNAVCRFAAWKFAVCKLGAVVAMQIAFAVGAPGNAAPAGDVGPKDVKQDVKQEAPPAPDCGVEIAASPVDPPPACADSSDDATDRAYLVETASPGYTMTLQGPDVAIGRLHPAFVHRLADAIREARAAGLSSAGIFSAYRPPIFGVGGFSDKFNSLHTYGLAVDMTGIGGPGSPEAKTWYEIAAKHGVICPYGVENRVEWNHCQPTWIKIIRSANPLRETVTANGPVNLESMFEAGSAVINRPEGADHLASEDSTERATRTETPEKRNHQPTAGQCHNPNRLACDIARSATAELAKLAATAHSRTGAAAQHVALTHCQTRSHAPGCSAHHGGETAEPRQVRSRQAAIGAARESRRL